jgi:hypothetical protein
MVDNAELRVVREAKARFGRELLENPDVHGVGVGLRRRGGEKTNELAVVVHVQRKRPEAEVAPRNLLPRSLRFRRRNGEEVEVPVDVVERPIPVPEVDCGDCDVDLEDRVRPVPGGYSGGPPTSVSNGGTLGGWLWDNVTDQIVVISNDHVFGGTAGTDISQPSTFDGGALPADRIADVLRAGTLDVSIAAPSGDDIADLRIECAGPGVYEIADAELEMVVQKTGQSTGLTCGIVELIDYDSNHYGSHDDLWIDGDGNDFSMGGDSGSLYLERDHPDGASWRRVVGIHWGGSGDDGVGHPIRAVCEDLDLTTVCAGLFAQLLEAMFGREEELGSRESQLTRGQQVTPHPIGRPQVVAEPRWWRRGQRKRTFARELEARLAELEVGAEFVKLLHRHRVSAVKVLLNPDGRRAVAAGLAPLAQEIVTTDELLDHKVTTADVANVGRLMRVAQRVAGKDMATAIEFVGGLFADAEGRTVRDLLSSSRR